LYRECIMPFWNRLFGKKTGPVVPVQEPRLNRPASAPVATPRTAPVPSQRSAAPCVTLESILTLPPDEKLQEQLTMFKAHYDRASPEDRKNMPPPKTMVDISSQTEFVALSPDGSAIATRRHYDNQVFVVDANTRLAISSFGPDATTDPTGWLQFTPTGKELVTVAKNRRSVVFLDIDNGRPIRQIPEVPANILQFAFSPDGSALAIAYDRGLLIWNPHDGSTVVDKKIAGTGKNCFLAWSRDAAMLAVVFNNEATVWSTTNWSQVYTWQGPQKANYRYPVMAVDFTPDGALIAGDNLGYVSRIDVRAQSIKRLTEVEAAPVWAISAAPNGSLVAVGRGDGVLELWDASEGRQLARASGHADSPAVSKYVQCIRWFPDGLRLCTWGGYDTRTWSVLVTAKSEEGARQGETAKAHTVQEPQGGQAEAQALKAFADSVRKNVTSDVKLNQLGVAEKDPKKSAVYYLAALERKPGTRQYVDNLDYARKQSVDIDEIRRTCGFSAKDALSPTSFSCPTLDAQPSLSDETKRKGKALFEQAHEAPFRSQAQLEMYVKAVGTDPNMRGAWSEFGMLAAAAGRFDLADKCTEAVRVLDAGKYLKNAADLIGQAPLKSVPTPPAKNEATTAAKSGQPSSFWKCPKCKGIIKKGEPLPAMSRFDSVIDSVTCGGCGASYPRDEIYGGKYDLPEVSVVCPHCSASLRGPDELIGSTCPACKRPLPPRKAQ